MESVIWLLVGQASIRFYAELNDFLAPERRMRSFYYSFVTEPEVKDLIEGLGVPHTEVELILVNGESVEFGHRVRDGDRVSVYPVFESIDITPALRVRPKPLREPRFVVDTHLGRLAAYLRMFGFDAIYHNDADDAALATISSKEHRILLTRDRGLLKRSIVTHGHYVRTDKVRRQIIEVLQRFDLVGSVEMFTRCMECNGVLRAADKESISGWLARKTNQHYNEFQICPDCGRIYWKGSHYRRMRQIVGLVIQEVSR